MEVQLCRRPSREAAMASLYLDEGPSSAVSRLWLAESGKGGQHGEAGRAYLQVQVQVQSVYKIPYSNFFLQFYH